MGAFPYGVFRKRADDKHPPVFWKVYQYVGDWPRQVPSQRRSVFLGISETLPGRRARRMHPAGGEWPQERAGFNEGVEWLRSLFLERFPGASLDDMSTIPDGELLDEKTNDDAGTDKYGARKPARKSSTTPPTHVHPHTREEWLAELEKKRQQDPGPGTVRRRVRKSRQAETAWKKFRRESGTAYTQRKR